MESDWNCISQSGKRLFCFSLHLFIGPDHNMNILTDRMFDLHCKYSFIHLLFILYHHIYMRTSVKVHWALWLKLYPSNVTKDNRIYILGSTFFNFPTNATLFRDTTRWMPSSRSKGNLKSSFCFLPGCAGLAAKLFPFEQNVTNGDSWRIKQGKHILRLCKWF